MMLLVWGMYKITLQAQTVTLKCSLPHYTDEFGGLDWRNCFIKFWFRFLQHILLFTPLFVHCYIGRG